MVRNCANLYHVVVQNSVFENFQKTAYILESNFKWKFKHVHAIVKLDKQSTPEPGVRYERIKNKTHYTHLENNLLFTTEARHDFVCEITFDIPSLKNMCVKTILCRLSYLYKMYGLTDSKRLLNIFYDRNKSHFYMPKWSGKTYLDDLYISRIDCIYTKDYVAWYQHATELFDRAPFLVHFHFIDADKSVAKLCLKCIKFEVEHGSYQRIYTLNTDSWYTGVFVRNPMNWCHGCKQVPLFQTLTYRELDEQYGYKLDRYLATRPRRRDYVEAIVKKEYFVDGVKVKHEFFLPTEAFGGTHNPYLT